MRSSAEILSLILKVATSDNRIRAVLLNGSRANPQVQEDPFQDFDIVYLVTELNSFTSDHKWIDIFGEQLILQMPDTMTLYTEDTQSVQKPSFSYLMLFQDGNRIDLTLFLITKLNSGFILDSLTNVLLDKDHLLMDLPQPSDKDYYIKPPSEKEFLDTCNEFWWVSTYVAKGLWRGDITYAKEMLETVVRPMFLKVIMWHVGVRTRFSVSFGKSGKHMKDHLPTVLYHQILATYSDAQLNNIWNSVFVMTSLFHQLAVVVAQALHFKYNEEEDQNVTAYLQKVYSWSNSG